MNIALIGAGFVGLELAMALAKHEQVTIYDTDEIRLNELRLNEDRNLQFNTLDLKKAHLLFADQISDLKDITFFIVCVPTPTQYYEFPDIRILKSVCQNLSSILKKDDIIVFESSVYPGTIEQICIPILEKYSQLKEDRDFYVAYSPERICPSVKEQSIENVCKLVSARNPFILEKVSSIYQKCCKKIYCVSSIAVAEMSKMLENAQRDVNIALMNECSIIAQAMHIDMQEVLDAAGTKFNFLPFKPGLVGGHCIAVDPHYLAFQAKRHAIYPEMLITARKVNDGMTLYIQAELLKMILKHVTHKPPYHIGIFGVTYKENIPDTRNSLVFKFIKECQNLPLKFIVHDPLAKPSKNFSCTKFEDIKQLDVAIVFVGHAFYEQQGLETLLTKCLNPKILMDIPGLFYKKKEFKNLIYWHL